MSHAISVMQKTHPEQSQRFNHTKVMSQIKYLHRDEDFLVVDKPYDMRIDGDDSSKPTVASVLYQYDETLPAILRNVHQLDHATSGCYCLALNKKAASIASTAFARREVEKTYLAIVRGWTEDDRYIIDKEIACVPKNRYRMCIGTPDNPGRTAKTELVTLRRGYFDRSYLVSPSSSLKVTLVRLHPFTGRRHQLRLHCQHIGHPIVGDWHYEKEIMDYTDTFRMMLHAYKLVIPLGQERVLSVESENPFESLVKDMDDLVDIDSEVFSTIEGSK